MTEGMDLERDAELCRKLRAAMQVCGLGEGERNECATNYIGTHTAVRIKHRWCDRSLTSALDAILATVRP